MKARNAFFYILLFTMSTYISAQENMLDFQYEAQEAYPWGRLNPKAPKPVADYQPLIGMSTCKSTVRNKDQTWAEPLEMIWVFRYIMNGMAVQDETLKADGSHSGSIRQYNPDDEKWYVHYYSSATSASSLPTWEGEQKNDEIILHRPQTAPNGMEGFYRTNFYNITEDGFDWVGAWVSQKKDEKFKFETWKISCQKQQ